MRHSICRNSARIFVAAMAFAAVVPVMFAADTQAGMITALTWHSGVASVAGDFIFAPSDPNNDNIVGMSPNLVQVLQKHYIGIGPVDLVFTVVNTGGVTEYRINEGVSNSTGLDWSSYHMELGFGIGSSFVSATPGGGLDFDAPDYDSPVNFAPAFPSPTVTELDILASGFLPNTAFLGGIVFHLDIPDGITEFTLRQSPIPVPEPAAAAMLLAGLAMMRRRR